MKEINYQSFQNNKYNKPNDNFCSNCGYNYNSHNHKEDCNSTIGALPLGDNICILLFMLGIYIIYKRFKNKRK